MKDNYYKLRNTNRRKRKTNYSKKQSNKRKRQTKKLNYKKVFAFLVCVILFLYLICGGFSKLFTKKDKTQQTASEPVQPDITIDMAVIGDIMCHSTNFKDAYDSEKDTYDFSRVFTDISGYIQNADIAVGNLETTFAGKDVGYTGYPTFNTPEQLAKNIKDLGIDVVSTANNHSLDKKYAGLENTLNELDKVDLSHTGTYRSKEEQDTILTKDVNGIKIAFLSFTYGTNGIPVPSEKEYCINLIDEDLMKDQIAKAKALNPDLICVSMHWGDEYKLKQNAKQEKLADFLFENGVDIIFGSHPHVLEPMEKREITLADGTKKDGFVIYSLGNFMSGQVAENTMDSIILQLQITKHSDNKITIDKINYIPIYMYDKGAGKEERYKILDINKMINAYRNGDNSISEKLYKNIQDAKFKIDKIMKQN
ncbi:MAG: CapA family protein [Clostridia bacterium]|nr:CapA family protein [Clostridia bacterium]